MKTNIKTVTIQAWGNSQGIRLTRDMLRDIGINDPKGAELDVEIVDGELRLSSSQTPYERLMKQGAGKKMSETNRKFSWEEWPPEISEGCINEPQQSPKPAETLLEPTTRLSVTPEQQYAVNEYLDRVGHNKTLFMSQHQQRLMDNGWQTTALLPLNDLSIDDLGKALFVGMIPVVQEPNESEEN